MPVLDSISPTTQLRGIIVDPGFSEELGAREATALAHTAYEVLISPAGQQAIAARKESDDQTYNQRLDDRKVPAKARGVLTALIELYESGAFSIQTEPIQTPAASPETASEAEPSTYNPATEAQKEDNGEPKTVDSGLKAQDTESVTP